MKTVPTDEETDNIHNMSRTQLLAPAAVITSPGCQGDSEMKTLAMPSKQLAALNQLARKRTYMYFPNWTRNDLKVGNRGYQRFPLTAPAPKLSSHDSPFILFYIFLRMNSLSSCAEKSMNMLV